MSQGEPRESEPHESEPHESEPRESEARANRLGPFPVVGIGASAGGLEALTSLLHAVQFDSMAFVVVQHRSAQHASLLVEILGRSTRMTVREITEGMTIEANRVFLAPPGACVALLGHALHIVNPASGKARLPIDFFFRSLAEELGDHAIGIVLSGMGSDGTLGLRAINDRGGICLVQAPDTAKFPEMPRSAIEARAADAALSPEDLAAQLASIGQHPYLRPGPRRPSSDFQRLFVLLRDAFGQDLSGYKETTIARRIERRMAVQQVEKLDEYIRFAEAHPEELATLYHDLLINVTAFFRDPASFEFLKAKVFPRIIERKKAGEPIRIWVPACSTGEEAYSLAMCVLEVLGPNATDVPLQVFGTDVDIDAIARARRGAYSTNIEADVSPERLERFFTRSEKGYSIGRRVRDVVIFSTQDVVKDPPLSRLDLVSCRNLLIYMQAPLQKRVFTTLHYALRSDGFLVLGASETPGEASDLFAIVDRKVKIYEKKPLAKAPSLSLFSSTPHAPVASSSMSPTDRRPVLSAQQLADRRILEHYAPPSVLVTEDLDVLLFRGDTAPYVAPASGAATLNVMRLVRPDLHLELWRGIEQARNSDAAVRQPPVRFDVKVAGQTIAHDVSIEVAPLHVPDTQGRCLLIVFHEVASSDGAPAAGPPTAPVAAQADDRTKALEQELSAAKEFLQSTIEELESSNEELKSTNEELQSANEELQSTNEELETSKEELQATNEELTSVNDELQRRLADLGRRDSDLSNVLRAVPEPVLLVDGTGRIRSFSTAAGDLLGLGPNDVGRALGGLGALGGIKVERLIERCIDRLAPVTEEVLAADGRWHALTARPYATAQGALDGAIVILADIDVAKRAKDQILDVSAYADRMLPAIPHPLVMLNEQSRVLWANGAFFETFSVDASATVGNLFHNLGNGQWAHPKLREKIDAVLRDGTAFRDFVVEHSFESLGTRRMSVSGSRVRGTASEAVALVSIVDVSPRPESDKG